MNPDPDMDPAMNPDLAKMQAMVDGLPKIADKIRALDRAGYKRADIARALRKRYQHVRNVLEGDRVASAKPAGTAFARPASDSYNLEERQSSGAEANRLVLGADGRLVVPSSMRNELNLKAGDVLLARVVGDEIHLMTVDAAVRRVRETFALYRQSGVSEVDDFLAQRGSMWGE